jgi:MFS transporter, CP family, cyanate transporter
MTRVSLYFVSIGADERERTVEEANVWNAFVLTVGYLIASTGPLLVGRLRDVSGEFRPGMWLCVGVAVVMLLLTPFLRPKAASA